MGDAGGVGSGSQATATSSFTEEDTEAQLRLVTSPTVPSKAEDVQESESILACSNTFLLHCT